MGQKATKDKLSMKKSLNLSVPGPWFFSSKDEEIFFEWLNSVASVRHVGGAGYDLEITFASRRIPQRDLREMIAIFHRYGLKKDVLKCFDNSRMKWFRDPKKYWYEEIFGTRSKHTRR